MNSNLGPRVKETSTTTGTGTLSLAGAVAGFQTFVSAFGNGGTCYYTIVHGTAWETGQGTVTDAATDTLSRDTVYDSSAGGAKLNLGTGEKTVFCDALKESFNTQAGYLWGMTLSNNSSDATNDIDITLGQCVSDNQAEEDRIILTTTSTFTKRLDATWASGTGQGGRLSSDALANGTWHVFAFKPSSGADDVFFSTSLNPTPPSGTKKRRIGSILRESAAIVGFTQDGDYFRRKVSVLDINATNPGTSAVTATLSVPTGLAVWAMFNVSLAKNTDFVFYASDLASTDAVPNGSTAPLAGLGTVAGATNSFIIAHPPVRTNASAQIRYRISASDASSVVRIATLGWLDYRGTKN